MKGNCDRKLAQGTGGTTSSLMSDGISPTNKAYVAVPPYGGDNIQEE